MNQEINDSVINTLDFLKRLFKVLSTRISELITKYLEIILVDGSV